MPHCILEYSQNLGETRDVPPVDLLEAVKAACIASTQLFYSGEDIRIARAVFRTKSFLTRRDKKDAFIHVILRMYLALWSN